MSNRTNTIYYIKLLGLYIGRVIVPQKKAWLKGQARLRQGLPFEARRAKEGSGGQVLLEYAIIAVLVVSAIIGIQLYLQRALQGRYKAASDYALMVIDYELGVISTAQNLYQYDPYYHISDFTTQRDSEIESSYFPGGESTTEIRRDEQSRTGETIISPYTEGSVE